eukprot:scaffold4234_cov64-Phaeocystis_antarctica.AAC.2
MYHFRLPTCSRLTKVKPDTLSVKCSACVKSFVVFWAQDQPLAQCKRGAGAEVCKAGDRRLRLDRVGAGPVP